ncbi:MAG: dipeptidyl aminopeptidase IV [Stygiobacter sp.]|nr:MAG: dipeptidyl aminopeptidase IV [Stygiobacter sp.]KAF0215279.1 MAG: dipeptidyl aminopeptidase [Ignavibacteria bacterium]
MIRKNYLLLTLLLTISLSAQQKLFTVEDVVMSGGRMQQQAFRQLTWIPSTDTYSWLEGSGDKLVMLSSTPKATKIDTLLKLSDLNTKLKETNEKTLTSLVPTWINGEEITFWNGTQFYSYNVKYKKLNKNNSLSDKTENRTIAPNNKYVAYTIKNNLLVSVDGEQAEITFDKDSNIVNGQAVHRNEFGINGGIFWSPKSNYVAFYRMDESMVTNYPLVDVTTTPAVVRNTKYPMAGQASHHVTVGIYEIKTGKTVWLKTGEPLDQYLTCLTWSPDEKTFFIAHLNRDQNHMEMKKYDVASGNLLKVLFEEKSDKYVEPQQDLTFLPNSSDKFIWQSQRDGFNHLYLYDTEGKLIKQITQGKWVVTYFNGFDKTAKNIFVTTTKESPMERHLYKVNIESGKMERITKESGTHNVSISSSSEFFIDSYTNYTTPRVTNILNAKYEVAKNLVKTDNPYKDYNMPVTKLFTIKNSANIDLYCRLILPTNFDSTKIYPVIFYVYGGPHAQEVNNIFGAGRYFNWFYLMAQKGYIVFTLDNRGSANRGLEFEQATFRRLGTFEVEDQMTGVNYLKTLPYVDPNRFGVYGWSYGGFMATSLMLRTNNAFKVAVGGGAVIDWKFYEVMYGERYMDTPQTNPDGFKEASLLNYVENLKGKLLLVHGTSDPTVVWQNTLTFAKKAQELNKPLDYFPYVGHPHGVGGRDALHLYTKITNYFLENL